MAFQNSIPNITSIPPPALPTTSSAPYRILPNPAPVRRYDEVDPHLKLPSELPKLEKRARKETTVYKRWTVRMTNAFSRLLIKHKGHRIESTNSFTNLGFRLIQGELKELFPDQWAMNKFQIKKLREKLKQMNNEIVGFRNLMLGENEVLWCIKDGKLFLGSIPKVDDLKKKSVGGCYQGISWNSIRRYIAGGCHYIYLHSVEFFIDDSEQIGCAELFKNLNLRKATHPASVDDIIKVVETQSSLDEDGNTLDNDDLVVENIVTFNSNQIEVPMYYENMGNNNNMNNNMSNNMNSNNMNSSNLNSTNMNGNTINGNAMSGNAINSSAMSSSTMSTSTMSESRMSESTISGNLNSASSMNSNTNISNNTIHNDEMNMNQSPQFNAPFSLAKTPSILSLITNYTKETTETSPKQKGSKSDSEKKEKPPPFDPNTYIKFRNLIQRNSSASSRRSMNLLDQMWNMNGSIFLPPDAFPGGSFSFAPNQNFSTENVNSNVEEGMAEATHALGSSGGPAGTINGVPLDLVAYNSTNNLAMMLAARRKNLEHANEVLREMRNLQVINAHQFVSLGEIVSSNDSFLYYLISEEVEVEEKINLVKDYILEKNGAVK